MDGNASPTRAVSDAEDTSVSEFDNNQVHVSGTLTRWKVPIVSSSRLPASRPLVEPMSPFPPPSQQVERSDTPVESSSEHVSTQESRLLKLPVELQLKVVEELLYQANAFEALAIMLTSRQLFAVGQRCLKNSTVKVETCPLGPLQVNRAKRAVPLCRRLFAGQTKNVVMDVPAIIRLKADDDSGNMKSQLYAPWIYSSFEFGFLIAGVGASGELVCTTARADRATTMRVLDLFCSKPGPIRAIEQGTLADDENSYLFPINHDYLSRTWSVSGFDSARTLVLRLQNADAVIGPLQKFNKINMDAIVSVLTAVIAWGPPVAEIRLTGLGRFKKLLYEFWSEFPEHIGPHANDNNQSCLFYRSLQDYPFLYTTMLPRLTVRPQGPTLELQHWPTYFPLYHLENQHDWNTKLQEAVLKRYKWTFCR